MSEKTPKIVLMTHGRVGAELIQSLDMIVGITDEVYAVPLVPGQTLESYVAQVSEILEEQDVPSILLVDLFGGTPSNCAGSLSAKYDVEVVSGVNVPMLVEAVQIRGLYTGEKLRQQLIAGGCGGIHDLTKIVTAQE